MKAHPGGSWSKAILAREHSAVRAYHVRAAANSINVGDMIPLPVEVVAQNGEEKSTIRRMMVTFKSRHVFEVWDNVSHRRRYYTYQELAVMRKREENERTVGIWED